MTRRVQASPVLAAYRTATASRIATCAPRTGTYTPRITSRCYNSKKASNPGPNVGGPLGNGYPDWWRKTSNLGRDGPDSLERLGSSHTIFTLPGATKDHVLNLVRKGSQLPRETASEADEAAVILASPRHASWLTDSTFMASLVSSLQGSQVSDAPAAGPKHFHVLAAVVDSLCPESESHPHHQPQEGLSIHLGTAESLLPGLWNDTATALPPVQTVDEPSHLNISINKTAHSEDKMSVTLPLANTLFQNGRRSTLLASKWATRGGGLMSPVASSNQLLKMLSKRCQTICLPLSPDSSSLAINSSLTPITWPRMILESLGNILAKVDIEGVPSPASKELQVNVPRLIEARRSSHGGHKNAQARIGVWAAIIPGKLILPNAITNSTQRLHQDTRLKDNFPEDQDKALPFNLFTSSSPHERQGWPTHTAIGPALLQGCRLHRIMSGGGEWGAKASLLSLDPQTSYGLENEQDELLRFQRSFFGEEEADEAIAKPGDFVQFYVDKETHSLTEIREGEDITGSSLPTKYPRVVFGVGEHSPAESDAPTEAASESTAANELAWLVPDHFGGISAEALYIESASQGVKTKLDAPGMRITLGNRRRP